MIAPYSAPNRWCASIISKPLFSSVALSTVILAPIFHVGCESAIAGVTFLSCSGVKFLNAPPLAVIISRLKGLSALKSRHCQIAECSLSTGTTATPFSRASGITMSPPHTSVSLLARARVLPALIAASEYLSPAKPLAATRTTSASSYEAAASAASLPQAKVVPEGTSKTFLPASSSASAQNLGFTALICSSNSL